ncbi:acyl-CoA desaturase [Salibacter sp.]|uniref:fatty acid desaturase family protein n=1 Tax=Salibacter sp. TaxID=2010995 RepID=UPI00286FD917|nr:acyl-CoA desaturase [Salibacter sp.]MDR9486590.1 acyl-CoA desaturase [Salibacter sp.]
MKSLRFNRKDNPEFIKELRKNVNQYFKDNNISKHANLAMVIKTLFMVSLYFSPLVLMLTGVVTSFWGTMAMWTIMGFGMAGIGLSVMHDANHGAYSNKKWVNKLLGFLANFLGAYHINWKIQHNVLHHSFTNVDGMDDDIANPVMRFSPIQKKKWIFKFQAFYAPFFYSIMTLYWFLGKDFVQLIRYNKEDLLVREGMTFKKALSHLIFNKVWYIALTIALPIILIDLPWWQIMIGFVFMQMICGLLLALIFQTAHVIEETSFYEPAQTGTSMENNWAIHQLKTTANFAHKSVLLSWFIGGLNYQIEHHLFPNICHIHYKKLSEIVKKTAEDYNIPYYQHTTFAHALKSHFSMLNQLGTGAYDKKVA